MTRIVALLALSMVLPAVDVGAASRPGADETKRDGNAATHDEVARLGSAERGSCGARGRGGRGRMVVVMRIAEALDLNEKQTASLHQAFRASATERRALLQKRDDLAGQLARELDKQKPSDATLTKLTNDIRGIDRQISALPDKVFQSFARELTVAQRARLVLLRGKLRHRVEREHQRRRAAGDGANRVLGKASGMDARAADPAARASQMRDAGGAGSTAGSAPVPAPPEASPTL